MFGAASSSFHHQPMRQWQSIRAASCNTLSIKKLLEVKNARHQLSTIPDSQRSHADTHFLSNLEIRRESLRKRAPGEGPGEFLHQRRRFPREFFASKEMLPIYPMLIMVSIGICLGILTMYRMLIRYPTLVVAKGKRRGQPIPEIGDEDLNRHITEDVKNFYEKSPFRAFGLRLPGPVQALNHKFFHQPPRLTPAGHPGEY